MQNIHLLRAPSEVSQGLSVLHGSSSSLDSVRPAVSNLHLMVNIVIAWGLFAAVLVSSYSLHSGERTVNGIIPYLPFASLFGTIFTLQLLQRLFWGRSVRFGMEDVAILSIPLISLISYCTMAYYPLWLECPGVAFKVEAGRISQWSGAIFLHLSLVESYGYESDRHQRRILPASQSASVIAAYLAMVTKVPWVAIAFLVLSSLLYLYLFYWFFAQTTILRVLVFSSGAAELRAVHLHTLVGGMITVWSFYVIFYFLSFLEWNPLTFSLLYGSIDFTSKALFTLLHFRLYLDQKDPNQTWKRWTPTFRRG